MNLFTAGAGGAAAGTGVATTLGVVGGPIGIAIVGLAAALGALGFIKGKTQHLSWDEAIKGTESTAVKVTLPFVEKYGYPKCDSTIAKYFAIAAASFIEQNYREGSPSWGAGVNAIASSLRGRADGTNGQALTLSGVIHLLFIFSALNFDASNPPELVNWNNAHFPIILSEVDRIFPSLGLMDFAYPKITNFDTKKKDNKSAADDLFGGSGLFTGSGGDKKTDSSPDASQQTSTAGASGMQLILAFAALGGIITLATRKRKAA